MEEGIEKCTSRFPQGTEEREARKNRKDRSWVVGQYESGHLLLLGVRPPSLLPPVAPAATSVPLGEKAGLQRAPALLGFQRPVASVPQVVDTRGGHRLSGLRALWTDGGSVLLNGSVNVLSTYETFIDGDTRVRKKRILDFSEPERP